MKPATLLVSLSVLAVVTGCSKHETSAAARPDLPPAKVRVATVRVENVPLLTEVSGTVRPVQRAVIAAKVMGAIEEMPVTLGQPVREGDLLVKIAAGEISARVLQAQSQLNQARRDLERERGLLEKGASTADMVKSLQDRLAMTEAMVREAEVMLGYTSLRAPFTGVVARKMGNTGDLAAPGMPLLEIEGTGDFQVEAGIPDSLAARMSVGTSLPVEVPVAGATFTGRVVEISSAADPMARTVPAKISVPAGAAVRSGQFARLQIPGTPAPALLVAATAVTTHGQLERVFVVRDGRAELRLVKKGGVRGDLVEILSGLSDGETVLTNPPAGLREGQPLEILGP
jgi:membrane fusion protein, multidrug efflux system